jgi:signal transduction histidine kinase
MNQPPAPDHLLFLTIAHDLRNPLATLNQLVYLMEHQPDPKYVRQMKAQLNLCESVVSNVLALAGLMPSEKERVPVRPLLGDAVGLVAVPFEIEMILGETSLSVWVNREQMTQALLNVLRNAIEAIGEGRGRIEIAATEKGNSVCIDIADSGPGFPSAVLAADLQPVVSSKKDGIGIGLAAAARIIRANRGTLSLQNRPGHGACCSLILPCEP